MKRIILSTVLIFTGTISLGYSLVSTIKSDDVDYEKIESEWISSNTEFEVSRQIERLEVLLGKVTKLEMEYSDSHLDYWKGCILTSLAGAKGGMTGLDHAKMAKIEFEEAIRENENVKDGLALVKLGVLFSKIPGWPIGFGDKGVAEEYFKRAVELNRGNIEITMYWLEYLSREERYEDLETYLKLMGKDRTYQEMIKTNRFAKIQLSN